MSKRTKGWRVIKRLTADEARAIRVRELRNAAATHEAIGEADQARAYEAKAEALANA